MRRALSSALLLIVFAHCGRDIAKSTKPEGDASTPANVTQSFASTGIKTVVLRGFNAPAATVQNAGGNIEVSGRPSGGAGGFKPSDPNWKETSAQDWGLGFVAKQFGDVLVISTRNEIMFIHHAYSLDALVLKVPTGVEVVRTARTPSGDGAPDLSPPSSVSPDATTTGGLM